MTIGIKKKLEELELTLPDVSIPGGNYVSVNVRGNIAYMAIQFPIWNEVYMYQGRLGENISTEEGYKAMQICALNVIAQIDKKVGIDKIDGLNYIDIYYRSTGEWDEAPKIANGASDLFINILEEKGTHTRAIFGVEQLPRNFAVGLTATFTLL